MIRVVVIDDHPALRAGVAALLRTEAGLAVVGVARSGPEVEEVLGRARPDVVLLDHHLPEEDGLSICRRIKALPSPPAVLMYSAFASPWLSIPARVAGADGVLDKGATAHEICEAVRLAARGRGRVPAIDPDQVARAERTIDSEDVPLLRLLLADTADDEVMTRLGLDRPGLHARVDRMLAGLRRA